MRKSSAVFSQLVKLLSDGAVYDGTSLGEKLGVTRSAVWKAIKRLEGYGINIQSQKGKGYALMEPLVLLDEGCLRAQLANDHIDVDVYQTVTTTNACFADCAADKIVAAFAEFQSQGRGRLKRQWISPFAENLMCSLRYPFNKDMSELSGLSLVVSLAMVHAIETVSGLNGQLSVKWPNDVFFQDKKLGGTLIEIEAEPHGHCRVIIGMGINVNSQQLTDDATTAIRPWTSLRQMTGQYIDRNPLAVELLRQLTLYLDRFQQHGLPAFMPEWQVLDCLQGKTIALNNLGKTISGTVQGINQLGHLQLQMPDQSIQAFAAGDVTTQV
ncbi:MAG: biotin--[acetyl-CoA-carboxylase] ligase [Coxiellaceae bacterium]|nr:biotin--[acetyl-CoA-carboxylase] ligase [Coxiellaceae bacterium]